jgi:hypothetical protein
MRELLQSMGANGTIVLDGCRYSRLRAEADFEVWPLILPILHFFLPILDRGMILGLFLANVMHSRCSIRDLAVRQP